jgi:hypothetical protein
MKKIIRLRESKLKQIIAESVRRVLNETRLDAEDNFPRLGCEKSRPGEIPPGDEDIYYPGDFNPDVWDALQRGDFGGDDDTKIMEKYIANTVRKVLNEKWYPEDDDDISDYSFGMIAKLSTRSLMQLDEEAIARLEQVNDENIETQSSYVNVMVRNIGVSCDEDGDCSLNIECAVSAPDMPIHEIEQEVEEILWYWIEERTGQHLVSGFDWESEDTVFDNRTKNK